MASVSERFFDGAHAVLGKSDFFEETRAKRRLAGYFKRMHELSEQLDIYLEKSQNQSQKKEEVNCEN